MANKIRCGLCDVEVQDWGQHQKTEEHQNKLPQYTEVKRIVVPIKKISAVERKRNKDLKLDAKAENLGYYPEHGRSYNLVRCECGEETELYCWSGIKRCPNCWKLISNLMSFKETTE